MFVPWRNLLFLRLILIREGFFSNWMKTALHQSFFFNRKNKSVLCPRNEKKHSRAHNPLPIFFIFTRKANWLSESDSNLINFPLLFIFIPWTKKKLICQEIHEMKYFWKNVCFNALTIWTYKKTLSTIFPIEFHFKKKFPSISPPGGFVPFFLQIFFFSIYFGAQMNVPKNNKNSV